jgi:hypothetical protein
MGGDGGPEEMGTRETLENGCCLLLKEREVFILRCEHRRLGKCIFFYGYVCLQGERNGDRAYEAH